MLEIKSSRISKPHVILQMELTLLSEMHVL